jgi:hypothetical protein
VLILAVVALTFGLMDPGSAGDFDRSGQSFSSFAKIAAIHEAGSGTVRARPVSMADVIRVESSLCSGCTDALNRPADPTSLLLVGTVLAGLGLVLRWLRRRRFAAEQPNH